MKNTLSRGRELTLGATRRFAAYRGVAVGMTWQRPTFARGAGFCKGDGNFASGGERSRAAGGALAIKIELAE